MDLTQEFLRELQGIVGARGVVNSPEGRLTYEADMHTFHKGMPDVVVLPESAEQVARLVRLCRAHHVPVVPRGSGTELVNTMVRARFVTTVPLRSRPSTTISFVGELTG